MPEVLLVARVVLAVTFLVAGAAKVADRPGSRRALEGFGVPPRLAAPAAVVLPLVEIAVAAGLLVPGSATAAAGASFVLLCAFCAAIGLSLARGRAPDCHCFGQLHSAPAGPRTLARNGALAAVALFVAIAGSVRGDAGPSPVAWLGDLSDTGVVAVVGGALLAALAWLCAALLRQHGRLLHRVDALEAALARHGLIEVDPGESGIPPGEPAPAFALPGADGTPVSLDDLLAPGRPVLLAFTDPGCEPCRELAPELEAWRDEHRERLTVAVIARGDAAAPGHDGAAPGRDGVVLHDDGLVADLYGVSGTPSAVLVGPDGRIADGVAAGAEAIRAIVARASAPDALDVVRVPGAAAQTPPALAPLAVGTPAPEIERPSLDGGTIRLGDFRGDRTLLLFWDPQCGFCQRMLDDLRRWDAAPPENAPRMLVVTTGAAEDNRELALRSAAVALDDGSVSVAFGTRATPTAVLVDGDGRIASGIAAGADEVLALAGGRGGA